MSEFRLIQESGEWSVKSRSSWLSGRWRRASQHIINHHPPPPRFFLTLILWSFLPRGGLKREQLFSCLPAHISFFIHPSIFTYLFPSSSCSLISFQSLRLTCSMAVFEPPPKLMTREVFEAVLPQQQDCKYRDTRETALGGLWLFSLSSAVVFMEKQNDASRKSTAERPCPFFTTELWPASPSRTVQVVLKNEAKEQQEKYTNNTKS